MSTPVPGRCDGDTTAIMLLSRGWLRWPEGRCFCCCMRLSCASCVAGDSASAADIGESEELEGELAEEPSELL